MPDGTNRKMTMSHYEVNKWINGDGADASVEEIIEFWGGGQAPPEDLGYTYNAITFFIFR